MNKTQRKIVASGLIVLAAIALIAIVIAGYAASAASRYGTSESLSVFAMAFSISFAAPSLVVLFLCLGLYLFKSDK
jgi:hypothetical protein